MNGIPEAPMCEGVLPVSPIIGIEKKCRKCQEIKPVEEFYRNKKSGYCWYCKICSRVYAITWRKNNLDRARERQRRWRKENPEKVRIQGKNSRFLQRKKDPDKHRLAIQKYRTNNMEKVRASQRKSMAKIRNTSKGYLNAKVSRAVYKALRKNKSGRHWGNLVKFTLEQLKKHLEKQFKLGMTWEKFLRGEIHLDHKIPTSAFNFETPEDDDFKRCWALKNLQPLWAKENLKKHAKLNKLFQPRLVFK